MGPLAAKYGSIRHNVRVLRGIVHILLWPDGNVLSDMAVGAGVNEVCLSQWLLSEELILPGPSVGKRSCSLQVALMARCMSACPSHTDNIPVSARPLYCVCSQKILLATALSFI